jgi:hypothetical protein
LFVARGRSDISLLPYKLAVVFSIYRYRSSLKNFT